jgi:archaellum component FlaC
VNCPKCGFEQEERVDCMRCGIVFSKYYALHLLSRSIQPATESVTSPADPALPGSDAAMTEVRQTLRDLQRRLGDAEYDRAERGRLRKGLKELEERTAAEFERVHDLIRALPEETQPGPAPVVVPDPDSVASIARETELLKQRFAGETSLLGTRLQDLQTELRQTLRDLQQRLGDAESDRAERGRLRKSLKALEERTAAEFERVHGLLQALPAETQPGPAPVAAPDSDSVASIARETELLKQRFAGEISLLATRLQDLQRSVAEIPEPPVMPEVVTPEAFIELEQELKEIYLHPLRDRMDQLEARLAISEAAPKSTRDPRIGKILQLLEGSLADLDKRVGAIAREGESGRIKVSEAIQLLEGRFAEVQEKVASISRDSEAGKVNVSETLQLLEGTIAGLERKVASISRDSESSKVKVSEALQLLEGRFTNLEKRVATIGRDSESSRVKVGETLQLLESRSANLEKRVVSISRDWESGRTKVSEALQLFEGRIADLDKRVLAISRDWESNKVAELLPRVDKGLGELEDLRGSLQSVTVRYSEIGELKKNHLVVLSNLESVRMTLETFKRQIAEGFPRTLTELGKEVAALRAEYRQIWQELHPSDSKPRDIH